MPKSYRLYARIACMLCMLLAGCDQSNSDASSICFCSNALQKQFASAQKAPEVEELQQNNQNLKDEIARLDAEIEQAKKDYVLAVSEFNTDAGQIFDDAIQDSPSAAPISDISASVTFSDNDSLNESFNQALARQKRTLSPCFLQQQLPDNQAVNVSVHSRIAKGKPQNALIVQSKIGTHDFRNCITSTFSKWTFPKTPKPVSITAEFSFEKKAANAQPKADPDDGNAVPADQASDQNNEPADIGFVSITTASKAQIYIDNELILQTPPIEAHPLNCGRHTIRAFFIKENTYSRDIEVNISKGSITDIRFSSADIPSKPAPEAPKQNIEPGTTGFVSIAAESESQVYIDGKLIPVKAPIESYQLASGTHTIRLYFFDIRRFSKSIEIKVQKDTITTLQFTYDNAPTVESVTNVPKSSSKSKSSKKTESRSPTKRSRRMMI